MAFGVYVHIPYCLQRCIYCDFATYETSQILAPNKYVDRVKNEIALRAPEIRPRLLDTLYFGGGTPSLLAPELLISIIDALREAGFTTHAKTEITLEINPATLNESNIEKLVQAGFNRFSVGAQTFDDDLLKKAHRKHSAQDTRDTLGLLKALGVNYSLDVLFALPTQTVDGLKRDVEEALSFDPPHVSPYCLTVPESHPFNLNRPHDDDQVKMFEIIEDGLVTGGLRRYEISNFAKPGFESRHNLLYWNDDEYWGIGLSSHSYLRRFDWGTRFWNPRGIEQYVNQIDALKAGQWSLAALAEADGERLRENQALTDFVHTALRTEVGLSREKFALKFKKTFEAIALKQVDKMLFLGLLEDKGSHLALTKQGRLLSNRVFEEFTFLAN